MMRVVPCDEPRSWAGARRSIPAPRRPRLASAARAALPMTPRPMIATSKEGVVGIGIINEKFLAEHLPRVSGHPIRGCDFDIGRTLLGPREARSGRRFTFMKIVDYANRTCAGLAVNPASSPERTGNFERSRRT